MEEQKTRGRKIPEEEKIATQKLFNEATNFFDKTENKKLIRRVLGMLAKHYKG